MERWSATVENAAAHRELAALADHVDPVVGQLDQTGDDRIECRRPSGTGVEFGFRSAGERHRRDIGNVGCHRLQ
jgi:hypothetical protein